MLVNSGGPEKSVSAGLELPADHTLRSPCLFTTKSFPGTAS